MAFTYNIFFRKNKNENDSFLLWLVKIKSNFRLFHILEWFFFLVQVIKYIRHGFIFGAIIY